MTAEYTYQPFGATTTTGADDGNPTRFAGREDDGNGLYYNRNRYYNTTTSTFTSKDPLGPASGTTNPYTYTANQPTDLTDLDEKPSGDRGESDQCHVVCPTAYALSLETGRQRGVARTWPIRFESSDRRSITQWEEG
ncbi:RHS repeat-associated core domain-containing protein [Actinocatenispora sera]|uniref:RHS repeat-associated core domain-containing protein n=1 Tax=Actinocatenispora sera TaxID=390989 RepID=UPI00340F49B7